MYEQDLGGMKAYILAVFLIGLIISCLSLHFSCSADSDDNMKINFQK